MVIGYYVIGNVHHALHTPLMSVTNAISGIIVVGALLQLGAARTSATSQLVIMVLAFVAVLAGEHQHLRWLHRDPPHADDVPEGLNRDRRRTSLIQAAYIVAALLFIMSLAGLSKHETAARQRARHGRHGIALVATLLARPAATSVRSA